MSHAPKQNKTKQVPEDAALLLHEFAAICDGYAEHLQAAGFNGWGKHLRRDAELLRMRAERVEPPPVVVVVASE